MIFLQAHSTDAVTAFAAQAGNFSILDLISNGGWMLLPIILIGLAAAYVSLERYLSLRNAGSEGRLMEEIRDMIQNGNLEAALHLAHSTPSPVARMVEKGISRLGKSFEELQQSLEAESRLQIFKLQKNMNLLSTMAGAAPMLGLLGTVIGLICAFHKLSIAGTVPGLDTVAGVVYKPLVTAAAGLMIGICAYFAYNHLVNMIDKLRYRMEAAKVQFLEMLEQPV